MIRSIGSIDLLSPPRGPRLVRTLGSIEKVKNRLERNTLISTRKLARDLGISRTSIRRILKDDLGLKPYNKISEPMLTEEHKEKRKKFANWVRTNFTKEEANKILFTDEKMFHIDSVYNSQIDRIWAVNWTVADVQSGSRQTRQFPQKVMVWLGAYSEGVSSLAIFEKGSVDHDRHIEEVLCVALEYGSKVFGDHWILQQEDAKRNIRHLTQKWSRDYFPSFIGKCHWPPNSLDLNPLDYSTREEFARAIQWDKVSSKGTLIGQMKKSVRKIRQEVLFESCSS